MSDLEVVVKVCNECGAEKPLSGFYRNATCRGGYDTKCVVCRTKQVKASKEKRRAEMGEDAWLADQRERVAASRQRTGDVRGAANRAAQQAAVKRLIDAHRREFEALLRVEKYERGLL